MILTQPYDTLQKGRSDGYWPRQSGGPPGLMGRIRSSELAGGPESPVSPLAPSWTPSDVVARVKISNLPQSRAETGLSKPQIPKGPSVDMLGQQGKLGGHHTRVGFADSRSQAGEPLGSMVEPRKMMPGAPVSPLGAGRSSRAKPKRTHRLWQLLNVMSFLSASLAVTFYVFRLTSHIGSRHMESKGGGFMTSLYGLWTYGFQEVIQALTGVTSLKGLTPTKESLWDAWLYSRAFYFAPLIQKAMDFCIAVFLIQSLDKTLLCFGCLWMKLAGFKYHMLERIRGTYQPKSDGRNGLNAAGDMDLSDGCMSDTDPSMGPAKTVYTDHLDLPCNGRWRPSVLVQIPMCNERECYKQSIRAACNLDWPVDRLLVQVLDDSDDVECQTMIREEVNVWQQRGAGIIYMHRTKRNGHKAGNLRYGMEAEYVKDYEYVAVFDADFMPESNYLKATLPYFYGREKLALVQARWVFFNRDQNLLTRFQTIAMNYHFEVEQQVMSCYSRFFGFNGTAGVWRRAALDESGGWDSRTTVEDMDMAVRAHMRGWEFIYLNDVRVLCELPSTYLSYCKQQHRWHAGPMQLFRLTWKDVAKAPNLPLWKKVNLIFFFFLLRKLVLPFVAFILFCILLPASIFVPEAVAPNWAIFYVPLFLSFLHIAPADFSLWPLMYPFLIFENIMSLTKFQAVMDGLFGTKSATEWVVTKKIGSHNDITLEGIMKELDKKLGDTGKPAPGKKATANKIPKAAAMQTSSLETAVDMAALQGGAACEPAPRRVRKLHLREISLASYLLGAALYSIYLLDGRHFFFLFFQGTGLMLAGLDLLGDLGN